MNVLPVLIKPMHFLASNLSSARCSPVGSFFANKDQKSVGSMSTLLGVCQHCWEYVNTGMLLSLQCKT